MKATELNLGEKAYFIKENLVDSDDRISRVHWHEVIGFEVLSLRLKGDKVVVNENSVDSRTGKQYETMELPINKADLFEDKKEAVERAIELCSNEQERNAHILSQKRDELEEVEERRTMIEKQIEKTKDVDNFLDKHINEAMNGEIYKDDPF